jgi:phage-related minor tail protein
MANDLISINIDVRSNVEAAYRGLDRLEGSVVNSIKAADRLRKNYALLDKSFNQGEITLDKYALGVLQTDKAIEAVISSTARANAETRKYAATNAAATGATSNAALAAEKLANAQRMAGKSTNRFGMYAQQVGYQVGDFFVQVQSGTSALVAFGQQGTQLAGLLPGIYGAILGIGLSVTTAVLQSSGALKGLTFDFKRFGEDALKFIEPIMPAIRFLGDMLVWLGQRTLDAINLMINAFQYLKAAWVTVPSAIEAGVDWISGQFHRLSLVADSSFLRVQASWIALTDLISGSTTMVNIVDVDANGNVFQDTISAVEDLTFKANNLSHQAEVLGKNLKETGGFGKAMADSLREVERIDVRNLMDYFGRAEEAAEKAGAAVKEVEEKTNSLAQSIADSIGSGFMSMVEGTKTVKDAFRDMARDIIKQLYEVLVIQRIVGSAQAGTGIAGALGKMFGGFGGASANGNAFSAGRQIQAYANGGVIGGPTYFPMAGGKTGLMGEAGPEAIMPLKRGKDGKLGVSVDGNSGSVVVNNTINVTGGSDPAAIRMEVAKLMPQITNATKSAVIDARRRGGQMRAAFQ